MALIQPRFTVYLNSLDDGDPTEHVVAVSHQDQLRAEQEMMRANMPAKAVLTLTNAWCWAAMTRAGLYTKPWGVFRDLDCAGIDTAEEVEVDPTQAGTPAASLSS